jgi:hypothetical protein
MMVTLGVVFGGIVAAGVIAGGVRLAVTCIYSRGRKAERDNADKVRLAETLEELRKRMGED